MEPAKEELDQLMREKHGESEWGGDRKSENFQISESDTWSQQKTAELLGQKVGEIYKRLPDEKGDKPHRLKDSGTDFPNLETSKQRVRFNMKGKGET